MSCSVDSRRTKRSKKIFVLDTSVIIYNHAAIHSFDDNDIAIPITVLEELDNFKKGNDTKNYEAREFIRIIDTLSAPYSLTDWIPLSRPGSGCFKVIMHEGGGKLDAEKIFREHKADHRILNATLALQKEYPGSKVVLITKDVNLRLKAKSINIDADDFQTGKVLDVESLYTGKTLMEGLARGQLDKLYHEGICDPADLGITHPIANHYYILKSSSTSGLAYYNPTTRLIERIEKQSKMRITPRNAEQVFALHAITNPQIKLVTLQGIAGTGKTLLALAGALDKRRLYKQIYLARPIVPLSNKDLGFLPGDIRSKLDPFMQPLYDNLKLIKNQYGEEDRETRMMDDALKNEKLVISPLAYIRGRSLSNICFIVDESQNLTPHEVKTIITRAGEGTKIIFTGDIYQIDTPYLDSQSNGLSYLIDKIKHHPIYSHVLLEKGERSQLANLANDLL